MGAEVGGHHGRAEIPLAASHMIEIEDDGQAWIWIRDPSRPDHAMTGKYLFFSADREKLVEIARDEITNHGFIEAKVSRSLERSHTEYVLCLFDRAPSRVGELRDRHQSQVHCRGWKSNSATDRGVYSRKYVETMRHNAAPSTETTRPNTIVSSGGGRALTLEQAIARLVDLAAQKRIRSSDYRYMAIDATFGGHAVGSGKRRTRGKFSAGDWKAIIRAWKSEGPEAACEEFSMRWGAVALGGTFPEISEIEWIGLMS